MPPSFFILSLYKSKQTFRLFGSIMMLTAAHVTTC